MTASGRIMKALSGFYYVQTASGLVECKARGRFRKEGISPLVGDWVEISTEHGKGMIEQIQPRKNCFVRPAVSNLDLLVLLVSQSIPVTEPFLIDRITAIAGNQNVPVIICVNKSDLQAQGDLAGIYSRAGYDVVTTSAVTGEGIGQLQSLICGKTVAFTGNSGVGKSSILNCLAPDLHIQTGEVSERLGRGRHTTRHIELFPLPNGTFVADTPGFSSFDTDQMEVVLKENLQYAFPDFAPYLGKCQFHDCAHLKEPGCAVVTACRDGHIEPTRYESYVRLYEKAKEIKTWELNK